MPRKAPIRDFEAVIRQGGYRVTPQRQLILEAVRAGKGHSTPEQIYSRVTRTAPSLNRGGKVYEMAAEYPHHHLVCERCGRIERVDHASVRRAFRQIERTYDFTVTTDHLALFGVCSRCRKRAGRAHHR
jgi:Fur family ferric uptake transcriptional regulator